MQFAWLLVAAALARLAAAELPPAFPNDPAQARERTSFQTAEPWSPAGNLRADVAMVYGINATLPERVKQWRDRGYRVHLMTGVSWGEYQDYLYGRFDGENHEDNAQTDRNGNKISHGGDVYYMCPAENFGNFLAAGVQRALEAGVEAVHLEEPEFWARAGYSEGFKREWQAHYKEVWQPPHSSVDARWRTSKLQYFLYRRALEQVFRHVLQYNARTGREVKCYVPTHSLLNYAHWRIVSAESSLARIEGCDGYIAQVWTGTSRSPNWFRGHKAERTFQTAFLEYAAMQNLVRSTGRSIWYLNDPIEDNPRHDWDDYRRNWESTLTASLMQPEVWRFEVAPWPERVFRGRYPADAAPENRLPIPPDYAVELQVVMQALNQMDQPEVMWTAGTRGIGVLVSDSLMFQREEPHASEADLSHTYGLLLPLLERGIPVTPVQLENVDLPGYLDEMHVLVLSYQGQKPLTQNVHHALAEWVRRGHSLVVVDDDSDPYNHVREWWNEYGETDRIPRQDLFAKLGAGEAAESGAGAGRMYWLRENPVKISREEAVENVYVSAVREAARTAKLEWQESGHIQLRRGPYVVVAGLDGMAEALTLRGRFLNLFDPGLRPLHEVRVHAGTRMLLLDRDRLATDVPEILASACKALPAKGEAGSAAWTIEGVGDTPGLVLLSSPRRPRTVSLEGQQIDWAWDESEKLAHIRFLNEARPRVLAVTFEP